MRNRIFEQEKQTRKKFNLLKKYYDQSWDLKNHTLHVGLFKKDTKTLEKAYDNATKYLIEKINKISKINQESSVLDAGCGSGRTLIKLCNKYGCSGIGIDISDKMISGAEKYLKKINKKRIRKKLPKLRIKFIRGSGSELYKIFKKDKQFTHIISQDALFLVVDKSSLYTNLYRLLKKQGVLGIDDFLGESKIKFQKKQQELIYKMVNWQESLSFNSYKKILKSAGFNPIFTKQRNKDMTKTYNFLVKRMKKYTNSKDKTFKNLNERYKSIIEAVKSKKMGWGIFIATK